MYEESPIEGRRVLCAHRGDARTGARPLIERFPMAEVNAALERVRSGKVRFRAVLMA